MATTKTCVLRFPSTYMSGSVKNENGWARLPASTSQISSKNKVELSMSLNTEIPEIPIRRHTHWFVSIRVCRNIGVTGGIVVTYIELSVRFRIMIDFGCRSQDHGRPAMRTAEGSTALGSGLSFFQNGHLLFLRSTRVHSKNRGVPPVALKRNL